MVWCGVVWCGEVWCCVVWCVAVMYLAVVEALAEKDDLSDESGVWYHHRDGPEHGLQVVRQLSAPSIACTGAHRQSKY